MDNDNDNGLYKIELSKELDRRQSCVIQRYDTSAEYQCPTCMERYCDEHFRIHSHLDDSSSISDLK